MEKKLLRGITRKTLIAREAPDEGVAAVVDTACHRRQAPGCKARQQPVSTNSAPAPLGVAMGCAPTIGCRENGAVCSTVPLWPSLIPLCESSITGLRASLLDAAKVAGTAKTVVSEAATAMARTDLSKRTGDMGGPVEFENAGLRRKRSYLTAATTVRLVVIGHESP